jgi:Tetratricopeptide repeat
MAALAHAENRPCPAAAGRSRGRGLALLAILALLAWPAPAPATPLTKAEVLKLIRRNVQQDRVVAVVRELGMDFVITAEVIEELLAAGAGSTLVEELMALASAKRDVASVTVMPVATPPAPEPPPVPAASDPPGGYEGPKSDPPHTVPPPPPPPEPQAARPGSSEGTITLVPAPPVPPPPAPTLDTPTPDAPGAGGVGSAPPRPAATSAPPAPAVVAPAPMAAPAAPSPEASGSSPASPAPAPGPPVAGPGAPAPAPRASESGGAAPVSGRPEEPSKWEQVKPLLDRAQALAIEGELREAQALVAKALEIDPGEPEVWKAFKGIEHDLLVRAEGFLADGQVRRALREFQLIITRNPESSAGHAGMGLALLQLRNYGEAVLAFERALALDPGNARYRQSLTQAKNLQKASKALERTGQENLQQMLGDQPGKKTEP